jgi:hypothetical protein
MTHVGMWVSGWCIDVVISPLSCVNYGINIWDDFMTED